MSGLALRFSISGTAIPFLASINLALHGEELKSVLGRGAANVLFEHFVALESERSGRSPLSAAGGPTHFYSNAAKSLGSPGGDASMGGFRAKPGVVNPVPAGVELNIYSVGISQRYFGGDIEAEPGHALTIPVAPQAYGRRARTFTNLVLIILGVKGGKRTAVLAARGGFGGGSASSPTRPGTRKKGTASVLSRIEIMYLLVYSVHQFADKSVLPADEQIITGAAAAGNRFIDRLLARSKS